MASSSAASASTSTVPDKYISGVAVMKYAVKDADLLLADSWITLDTAAGIPTGFNVSAIVFDYGVSITQKSKGNRCTLELGPQQYSDPSIFSGKNEQDFITITIRCTGSHKRRLEGNEEVAKTLPLAQLCGDSLGFEYIRLLVLARKLTSKGGYPTKKIPSIIGHLKTLLTGHITLDVEGRRPAFLASSQRSLSTSIPHAGPEPPAVSPPSSFSVKTGDITATDLTAQLAELEQRRDSVIELLEKDYRADLVERKAKHDQDLLEAREGFETEIARIKERLAETSM